MYILYIDFFITYCFSITLVYCYYAFILYSYIVSWVFNSVMKSIAVLIMMLREY